VGMHGENGGNGRSQRCREALGLERRRQAGGGSAIHAALHYWPPPVVGALITTQRVLASGLP
jgi:hypothetical protein